MQAKILMSACLCGEPVRYDGADKTLHHHLVERWREEGRLVPVCPEIRAGLMVPRPPAEIAGGASGQDVLSGKARVVEKDGRDATDDFVAGAQAALQVAVAHGCRFALLIDGSPSCGHAQIYDGTFSGRRHPGVGVTAALLENNGIEVFCDKEIDALAARLAQEIVLADAGRK